MLNIIVKRAVDLSAQEDEQVRQVDQLAFSGPNAGVSDPDDIQWASVEWYVLGFLNGQIVSQLGLLRREIRVGEKSLPVGGVGGVCTHPDWQRHGFAAEVLERAEEFMREEMRVPFGLLICSEFREPYYTGLGWQTVKSPMLYDFKGEKRVFSDVTMIFPAADIPWPAGTIDLCGFPW